MTTKFIVEVPLLPSVMLTSATLSEGTTAASSLLMVPMPCASPITAPPVALDRFTANVSLPSTATSPRIVTEKVLLDWPAAMLCPVRALAT